MLPIPSSLVIIHEFYGDTTLADVVVDPPGIIAYHSLVVRRLPAEVGPQSSVLQQVRAWRQVDPDDLMQALQASPLCQPVADHADVNTYDRVLRDIANQLAPRHNVQRRSDRRTPWFDDECRSARTDCCRRESRYRRTRDIADRRLWVDAARRRFRLYHSKKEAFWMDRVSQDSRNSAQLWRSLSTMLGKNRDTSSTPRTSSPSSFSGRSKTSALTWRPPRRQSSLTQRQRRCQRSARSHAMKFAAS